MTDTTGLLSRNISPHTINAHTQKSTRCVYTIMHSRHLAKGHKNKRFSSGFSIDKVFYNSMFIYK